MDVTEVIERIKIGDREIKTDLWVIVDEYIEGRIYTYSNKNFFIHPDRIVRWVNVFIKSVKEGKVEATHQDIGAYFWQWKQKRITRELLRPEKR